MSEPVRKFAFKKSALADKADKIWSESKSDFSASKPTASHVHLEKKSLGDVLGKLASSATAEAKKKEQEEPPSTAFVFGSKIADRIVQSETKNAEQEKMTNHDEKSMTATELFKNAVKKDEEKNGTNNFRQEAEQEAERAKEAEKHLASTSVVELTTGEEADTNIFQASCKIWVFDKDRKEYVEKGVCTLRINRNSEDGGTHYRIVARTSGTLRVVINSNIFADMLLERPDKRIRISAMGPDSTGVQVFLLKFGFSKTDTGAEADLFYKTVGDLLKSEKGEQTRKRKAEAILNKEGTKQKDSKRIDEEENIEKEEEEENEEVERESEA